MPNTITIQNNARAPKKGFILAWAGGYEMLLIGKGSAIKIIVQQLILALILFTLRNFYPCRANTRVGRYFSFFLLEMFL